MAIVQLELTDAQLTTITKLMNEIQVARGISTRKGNGSSLKITPYELGSNPTIINEALAREDFSAAQYTLTLETWNPLIKSIFDPKPPPPPPLPEIGPINTGYITFDGGVPVGGWSQLTLFPDGSYVFEGSFHDSGAPSYNDSFVFAIKDNVTNKVYTFSHSGHMAGTFESGSRDDNWNVQGKNAELASIWQDFSFGYTWHWEAGVNWDLNGILNYIIGTLGIVLAVVAIV